MPTTDQQPAPFALPVRTHEPDSHILVSADGEYLGRSVYAKHIARAINSHDALVAALTTLRNDLSLWKTKGAGGQDQYAGMPPGMRLIDEALKTATL
jgi:hypothetical protein